MANRPKTDETPTPDVASDHQQRGAVDVVRSEERLLVGSQVRVSGRAVLRKYVVTETITQTFQVRHEEVRLDYEPVGDDEPYPSENAGAGEPGTPFQDHVAVEMVLHREVPTVAMNVVEVERVRLHVDTVTTEVTVSDDVRKERVSVSHLTDPRDS